MKKHLEIIVLGLLLSGNAYAVDDVYGSINSLNKTGLCFKLLDNNYLKDNYNFLNSDITSFSMIKIYEGCKQNDKTIIKCGLDSGQKVTKFTAMQVYDRCAKQTNKG
jgi:hypothetical protein